MALHFKQKLFYFFPVLFCFCLPFGSPLLSWIIVLWTLTGFFNIDPVRVKAAFRRRELWLLYIFFFLTLLSAFFSEDVKEAGFAIEIKLSFLLFPFLVFFFHWPSEILKRCLVAFVSGCFFACIFLIVRAFSYYLEGHPEYFFYSDFSSLIHTSYFSMYLNFAVVLVMTLYPRWFRMQKSVIYSSYFFVIVFVGTIFLCASKLGLLSFVFVVLFLIIYKWKLNMGLKKAVLLLVSIGLIMALASAVFPSPFERLVTLASFNADNIDRTSVESTAVRVLIWEQSLDIIRHHFFFGTGVGDANNELYRAYERNGMSGAFGYKLNAHNQYLQTFIGMGFISFLLMVYLTFGELVRSILRRRFLLFIFAFLICFNFMVESMLQRSAGVLFFAFFYCFLNLINEDELTASPVT